MANEIDLIVGSEAFAQITKLLVELGKVDTKLGELAASFGNLGKGATNPTDSAALKALTDNNAKLNAEILKLTKSYDELNKKISAGTDEVVKRSKYITQETIDTRLTNKELTQKYTELSKVADKYQQADAQYRIMAKSLKDLAFQGKEGTEDFIKKEKALLALGNRLKSVDAMTGSHTRNVGNYASSWNGLGNSINQLTREAPAFANSLQTGFMALSNNIPILTDELGILIDKNKKLKADGKPTESILKTVAGAFFSWQTAISLGVTVLTVYGGKLVELISEFTKGKEKINELKISQDLLNKSFEDSSVKNVVQDVNELKINIGLAKQGFVDKEKVVNQYNETIGKTTGLVTTLDEAEQGVVKNGDAYIKMTLYKATAQLALGDAAKASLEAEKSRLKELKEFEKSFEQADFSTGGSAMGTGAFNAKEYEADKERRKKAQQKRKQEEIKINEDAEKVNLNIAKKFQEDAAKIAKNFNFNLFGDNKPDKPDKPDKPERERKLLTFDEVKSQHDLDEAILATDKIREKSADMSEWTTEQKIANLDLLSLTEIKTASEIANKEIDIANKKMADDMAKTVGSTTAQNLAADNILREIGFGKLADGELLPAISRTAMAPHRFAGTEKRLTEKLAEVLANPNKAQEIMQKMSKSDSCKVAALLRGTDASLRYGSTGAAMAAMPYASRR